MRLSLQSQRRPHCFIRIRLLRTVFVGVAVGLVVAVGRAQPSSPASPSVVVSPHQASTGAPTASVVPPLSAPDAAPRPFLRLLILLFGGLSASLCRLAWKFRRFWGLGVLGNFWAVLYAALGIVLGVLPHLAGSFFSWTPRPEYLATWVADLLGLAAPWTAPLMGKKKHPSSSDEVLVGYSRL
jgi:hypothetical protein